MSDLVEAFILDTGAGAIHFRRYGKVVIVLAYDPDVEGFTMQPKDQERLAEWLLDEKAKPR